MKLRSRLKSPDELGEDHDSTSAQAGDVSSQHSANDETSEDMMPQKLDGYRRRESRSKTPQMLHTNRTVEESRSPKLEDTRDATDSSQNTLVIVELDDRGYEGDAEIQFPDGYEDVDGTSDTSNTSILAHDGSDREGTLTEEMQRLQVQAASSRKFDRLQRKPSRARRHAVKRSHSDDSLSEVVSNTPPECSTPPQKRIRRRSKTLTRLTDPSSDAMDLG